MMVKGNDSDVADIVFEITGTIKVQILLSYIVFSVDELLITLKLDIQF